MTHGPPLNFIHVVPYCVSSIMIRNCLLAIKKETCFALENGIPPRILQGSVFSCASHRWVLERMETLGKIDSCRRNEEMFDSFSRVDVQPVGCSSGKKYPELNIFELYLEFRRSVKRSAPLRCNSLCGAAGPLR